MWEIYKSGSVRGIEVLHKEFNYMINRKIKQIKENHIMPTRQLSSLVLSCRVVLAKSTLFAARKPASAKIL
jgi:hypothetical protein